MGVAIRSSLGFPGELLLFLEKIMKISHLINVFDAIEKRRNEQYLTMSSMETARDLAESFDIEVNFNACLYEKSQMRPTAEFREWYLKRSSYEVGIFDKKIPFIHEIFHIFKGIDYRYSPDIFVYSNADIILAPHFYTSLPFILKNRDAATILRTTIGKGLIQNHPGYDCFVFRKELLSKIKLPKNVFLGYPPVGNCVFDALRAAALPHNFNIIPSEWRLTFHAGDDKQWENHPYVKINQEYAYRNIEAL